MPIENIRLSVVLPAYNEAARLPPYLGTVRKYLDGRYGQAYEVIVVDDGSRDGLLGLLERSAADWPQLRWICHARNQGKGAAVRTGMLAAQGELLLFADADGATSIEEESRLTEAIHAGADLAIGSRLMRGNGEHRARSWARGLAGSLFAILAGRLLRLSVHDTQCGFKIFRADAGQRLFSLIEESRYLFDLELLARAQRLGYRIAEVPISWREIPGGHLHLVRDLPSVAVGLWRLFWRLR